MRGGTGGGVGQPAEPGDVAGEFNDALVVDVVQHDLRILGWTSTVPRPEIVPGPLAFALGDPGTPPYISAATAEIQCGRPPVTLRSGDDRSNGEKMDAIIKPLRGSKASDAKPADFRPAELDPSEFLAAAIRADQPRPSRPEAEQAVQTLLGYIGENPAREGLLDTPRRVVEAFDELYQGYHQCPAEVLDRTFGETAGYDDFVLIRDIEFTSQCEHHMMPFYGRAHIAYTPVERVVGLSKLARLTDIFARRLQMQEHLTAQIAAAIDEILKPRGVAVMIEAEHTCMSVRGVAKHGATTFTTRFTGMFRDNPAEQARFLSMARGPQR